MRAVAVSSLGATPQLMDLPVPDPGQGEVLVRMGAAGINPLDWKIASGRFRGAQEVFPLVLGADGAGLVEALGKGAYRFKVGDRIFGQFLHVPFGVGTYTEYTVVPENIGVARIPDGMTEAEAAALPTAGMTALVALEELGIKGGETLLVVGASGGVGSFVIPLAHAKGIRVIAVARARSAGRLIALGASTLVDVGRPDWEERVRAVAPEGVDGALDLVSDHNAFRRTVALVRRGGRAGTTIGAADSQSAPSLGVQEMNLNLNATSTILERLLDTLKETRLKIPVERMIGLEEAPEVLRQIQSGGGTGKVVIVFPPAGKR